MLHNDRTHNPLLVDVVKTFGTDTRAKMTIEECAELIVALNKYFFRGNIIKNQAIDKVASELADVEIMLEQMRIIFGNEIIDKHKEQKLKRLRRRLKAYNVKDK